MLLNTTVSSVPKQWKLQEGARIAFVDPKWEERLDAGRRSLLARLRAKAVGPGRIYMMKPFLPWLLPTVKRAVVVDHDLYFVEPPARLWSEFRRFDHSQMIGVARDVMGAVLYPDSTFGVNGGVQLLHLERMRSTPKYEHALNTIANSGAVIGYLGDQTLYTLIGDAHPDLLYHLSCKFNRQLNVHFRMPVEAYACGDGCAVIHGNQPHWKSEMKRWRAGSWSISNLRHLPVHLRVAFQNCTELPP